MELGISSSLRFSPPDFDKNSIRNSLIRPYALICRQACIAVPGSVTMRTGLSSRATFRGCMARWTINSDESMRSGLSREVYPTHLFSTVLRNIFARGLRPSEGLYSYCYLRPSRVIYGHRRVYTHRTVRTERSRYSTRHPRPTGAQYEQLKPRPPAETRRRVRIIQVR